MTITDLDLARQLKLERHTLPSPSPQVRHLRPVGSLPTFDGTPSTRTAWEREIAAIADAWGDTETVCEARRLALLHALDGTEAAA